VCCLDNYYDDYTTLSSFGAYIDDPSMPLKSEIDKQGACTTLNSPPSNFSKTLLDTRRNFVNGSFARMVRSTAELDLRETRGFQDVMLSLSLEDIEGLSAVKTPFVNGYSLRFFVGMAHIKPLASSRIAVSFSQVEIKADITNTYVFSTQTSTEFTFIRDVSVQLREIKHDGSTNTTKFATITVIVPETLSSTDAINIIPPTSLMVAVGFNKKESQPTRVYPCTETYSGDNKNRINDLLSSQSRCALQDPICSAQGPVLVCPGGSIQFTFPLEDSAWNDQMLDVNNNLMHSLYIDFLIGVFDQDGNKLLTTLQTTTPLKTTSIVRMCTELAASGSVEEIMSVDMFLGLVGDDALFNQSLVQNLDMTRPSSSNSQNMQRDISSAASNVVTLLVKGDNALFTQDFAAEYTLAVEDIFTMHFLENYKKDQVQDLIDRGLAFTNVKQPEGAYRFVSQAFFNMPYTGWRILI